MLLILTVMLAPSASALDWLFLPTGADPAPALAQLAPAEVVAGAPCPRLRAPASGPAPVWQPATFPHQYFDRLQPRDNVHGWYAAVFEVPESLRDRDWQLDLGVVDDADVAYVNGTEIGHTGNLTAIGESAWCRDRAYRIPAALLRPDVNLVLVQVRDFVGLGGIVGPPVLSACLVPAEATWRFLSLGAVTATGGGGQSNS